MAIISRADLFNYLKCSALAVKWQNILDSYWHKNDTIPASAIEIDVIEVIIQNAYVLTAGKTDLTKLEVNDKFRMWHGERYVVGIIRDATAILPNDLDTNKVILIIDN